MNQDISLQTLIDDVLALAKKEARGTPPRVVLSRETEALLQAVGQAPDAPKEKPKEASEQQPAPKPNAVHVSEELITPQAASILEEQGETLLPQPEIDSASELARIAEEIALCTKCPLGALRKCPVPGEGNPHAELVFVGEAPGAEEDRSGRPFVGRAGNLLTDIIVKGMKMKREDVFICNVLKCRPPDNRTPNPEEVMHCEPYLLRQLAAIRPKVICALGATAAQTMLKTKAPIKQLRGVWHDYHGIPLRVTYHPAYLLRNPPDKAKTWEDIKEVMRLLHGEIKPEL